MNAIPIEDRRILRPSPGTHRDTRPFHEPEDRWSLGTGKGPVKGATKSTPVVIRMLDDVWLPAISAALPHQGLCSLKICSSGDLGIGVERFDELDLESCRCDSLDLVGDDSCAAR